MSSNTKKSFLVYYDNEIIVCRLTDDEAGKLFKSLFPYGRDRIRPDFESSPALAMAFDVLALAIDRNDEWYREKCNKNRENILKRWSKGDTTEYDRKQSDTTEYDRVPKDKDKDRVREEKELNDTLFNSLTLKEGNASPPSADAGGAHPSLIDCQECADEGKVNLSEDGIKAFYNRMVKDGWKIKGKPVENLLKAMRGFAKNHKRYQKEEAQPELEPETLEPEPEEKEEYEPTEEEIKQWVEEVYGKGALGDGS